MMRAPAVSALDPALHLLPLRFLRARAEPGVAGIPASSRLRVLALRPLNEELGLLVGGFVWGAALWQVGSRTLVNTFAA